MIHWLLEYEMGYKINNLGKKNHSDRMMLPDLWTIFSHAVSKITIINTI